ncbi:MAG: chemotaxis protein CheW [Chloroflexi bacterium]|nr:chemotaxis protein CheW [Chloroflexota bacterium]
MTRQLSLVVFEMGEQQFGLPIDAVTEIIPLIAVSRVPNMPDDWLGVANVRGYVTPVVDYRVRVGGAKDLPPLSSPLIVIRQGRQQAALLVERIKQILTISDEHLDPSVIIHEGQLLMLIDPKTVLGRETPLS